MGKISQIVITNFVHKVEHTKRSKRAASWGARNALGVEEVLCARVRAQHPLGGAHSSFWEHAHSGPWGSVLSGAGASLARTHLGHVLPRASTALGRAPGYGTLVWEAHLSYYALHDSKRRISRRAPLSALLNCAH